MEIKIKVHTIFLMVGATESGKTTFAKEVLIPQLRFSDINKNYISNVQYISSDEIRQDILGYKYDKHDRVMLESSEHAFNLLFEKLRAATSFPINAEFVIVDTTGLSEEFRNKVIQIAKENHYNIECVLFDYKDRNDYFTTETSKALISNHLTRLRKEVVADITRKKYSQIHKIRNKNFYDPVSGKANSEYKVIVENMGEYLNHILPTHNKYIAIGDIHEKVEELKSLLIQHGFNIDNNKLEHSDKRYRIILVGDYIDKGHNTKETIDFIYNNKEWFYIVLGNHENFVYKYINGEISKTEASVMKYFDSINAIQADKELKDKFFELVNISKNFYRHIGTQTPSFYVTHAPVQNKYLGKIDNVSQRNQRRFAIDRDKPVEGQLQFLVDEAVSNNPFHVFGHVAVKGIARIKNKINIDTGCVHGNYLSSVTLDSWKPFYRKQKTSGFYIEEDLPLLFQKEENVSLNDLSDDNKRRLRYALKNKINFISGTMSPSDKDVESNDLESLKSGLMYYKNKGVDSVVLQPKYMGSRCNIYLDRNIAECFAVSRNGYKIKQVDLTQVYEKLLQKFSHYMKTNNIKTFVLDGELLPWSILGKGLIERQFRTIGVALETELSFLKQNDFENQFLSLVENYNNSGFEKDSFSTSNSELSKKYGNTNYQNYKNVKDIVNIYTSVSDHYEAYQNYKKQVELYGFEGEATYKPFSILKEIYNDGSEKVPNEKTSEIFNLVSDDDSLLIDFNKNPKFYEEALQFYNNVTTEKKMEGVVIKPEIMVDGVAPYLKVRNPNYLIIVYGYDYKFPHKYEKLMEQKNIRGKLETSIKEYKLGEKMLSFCLDSIDVNNKDYMQVVANMLFEVEKERDIDPRL
jgi:predicted kinase